MEGAKQAWVDFIKQRLDELFPTPSPTLCNGSKNPYKILIAVLLSARARDEQVEKVMDPLFNKWHSPEKMSRATASEIREIIKPCGLSKSKSEAIKKLSYIIHNDYSGKIPNRFEELEKLPGVGHKTASVVLNRVFGQATFPVDTHIHRLATKWHLTLGRSVVQTENDLKALFPQKTWGILHLQLIYYGRNYCNRYLCTKNNLCTICRKMPKFFKK